MSIVRGMGAKVAAGGVLAMLALSGCSATETSPPSTRTPSPTPSPIFANEQEALAAAKKAYERYEAISDLILQQGGRKPERVQDFASPGLAKTDIDAYQRAHTKGWHSTGESAFDNFTLQSFDGSSSDGVAVVAAYLCSDVSAVDVLDSSGKSIVSSSRTTRLPFLVTFDVPRSGSAELVVGSAEAWEGDGVC